MEIAPQEFVHLHLHTEYSLLDGACRIERLISHIKSIGQTSVAITDHGVMFGCVDFYKAAKKQGIKPIIGCEAYVAPRTRHDKTHGYDTSPYHLVLLCKNDTGYRNLAKLVSYANTEGFYVKPRIDRELIERYHEGLICLSACLAGEIPQALIAGDYERAREVATWYKEIFADDYYIELQDHGIEEQIRILPDLIRLARELNIPLVATNDCHYVEKSDSMMQHALICVQTNKTFDDKDVLEFKTDNFYVRSTQEMADLFAAVPEAVTNTAKVAEKCNYDFVFGDTKLPYFKTPDGSDNEDFFENLCRDGLAKHYGETPDAEIEKRLDYELSVIKKMGYTDYFLIVWDFIYYAKSHDIPVGPGRGSGAGSLCAYCMGITGVDPIKYNLLFERFLNPERVSMPDFDIDFCYERRPEVLEYVVNKYGADHVAQIITFGTMAARAAIRDIGRVLGLPYSQVDMIAKLIPQEIGITIEKALERSADFKAVYDSDPQAKRLIDLSMKVEGMPRHASTHAAGVVITRDKVSDYVPLQKNDEQTVTQYPMTTLEELGLLKMDFLGLRTLTVISDCEREIRKTSPEFSIEAIADDDAETYKMLADGRTSGVFQYESGGMRQVLIGLRPYNLEDLIAVISLYRPGPMDSIPIYIENRHHPEKIKYAHPSLEPILGVTNGCIVYQEQVMQIFRELAGFSYGQADLVRRAMSKKKHDVMEQEGKIFIYGSSEPGKECDGCLKRGIPERVAKEIYGDMAAFASYAFNKSHAAAYAVVSYRTAYLKCHYPVEYMAALLTSVLDNTDKVIEYISECRSIGIEVLPPDVNVSGLGFTVDKDSIRFGLLAIKSVGRNLIGSILRERESGGAFRSFLGFCERMRTFDLNKRALESLIKCGSFDSFGVNRRSMVMGMDGVLKDLDDDSRRNVVGQISLFGAVGEEDDGAKEAVLPAVEEYDKQERLRFEKELTGLYLSSHPLLEYDEFRKKHNLNEIKNYLSEDSPAADGTLASLLVAVSSVRIKITKSNETMAFVTIEDMSGMAEMIVFPKTLAAHTRLLKENNIIMVKGRVSIKEDDNAKLVCEDICETAEYEKNGFGESYEWRKRQTFENRVPAAQEVSRENSCQVKRLYIKFSDENDARIDRANGILGIFGGETPTYYYYEDSATLAIAPQKLWANPCDRLMEELIALVGESCVVLKAAPTDKSKPSDTI